MVGNHPIPGNRCWAQFCGSYGLPDGLEPRTSLVVIDWHQFAGSARDEQGRVWNLNRVQIDAGFSFYLDGGEFPESHPKCAAYLRNLLKDLNQAHEEDLKVGQRAASPFKVCDRSSSIRWMLERNGFDPDEESPQGPVARATGAPVKHFAPNPRLPIRESGTPPRRMNS